MTFAMQLIGHRATGARNPRGRSNRNKTRIIYITARGEHEQGDRRPNRLGRHNPIFPIVLFVNIILILEDIENIYEDRKYKNTRYPLGT
jgi:hypothetical protein